MHEFLLQLFLETANRLRDKVLGNGNGVRWPRYQGPANEGANNLLPNIRISEQEVRFAMTEVLVNRQDHPYHYGVEIPTLKALWNKTESRCVVTNPNDDVVFAGRSASIDLGVFQQGMRPEVQEADFMPSALVEIKSGNPKSDALCWDLAKLYAEGVGDETALGWVTHLTGMDVGTQTSLRRKISRATDFMAAENCYLEALREHCAEMQPDYLQGYDPELTLAFIHLPVSQPQGEPIQLTVSMGTRPWSQWQAPPAAHEVWWYDMNWTQIP